MSSNPGVTLAPTGVGNYIQLEVGQIEADIVGGEGDGTDDPSKKSVKIKNSIAGSAPDESFNVEENISIFPNPNNGSFTVSVTNDVVSEISVINMYGQLVQYTANNNAGSLFVITLPNAGKGLYLVRLKGKQKTYVQKILVE